MLESVVTTWRRVRADVRLNPASCLRANRVGAARSDCRACADACPDGAVRVGGTCEIDETACGGCRFCVAACPAAAIDSGTAFRREIIGFWKDAGRKGRGTMGCARSAPPSDVPAIVQRCLASFVWEHPVIALLAGARGISLFQGNCAACPDGARVAPLIEKHAKMARRFSAAAGLGAIEMVRAPADGTAPADGRNARDLSRRALFSMFLDTGRGAAASAVDGLADRIGAGLIGTQRPTGADAPWQREVLCSLTKDRGIRGVVECGGLAGRPEVSPRDCTFCGICAAGCPNGALDVAHGMDEEHSLGLLAHRCTGCGSCAKACREGAIRLTDGIDLAEWGRDRVTIATGKGPRCRVCGKIDAANGHDCRGSGRRPDFVAPAGTRSGLQPVC